jgi:hypothetical protein
MGTIKLVLLASGMALSVAACADMMGGRDIESMEPAAGRTVPETPAMTDPTMQDHSTTMPDRSMGGAEGPAAGGETDDSPGSPVD